MLAIAFPNINPVIISIGPLSINWYSLSYVCGILLAWRYLIYIIKRFRINFSLKDLEDFISYAILGIIIGGRLGYVFFYDPSKYLANPLEIIKTYEGGMSFHGGLVGLVISALLFCKKRNLSFLLLTDLCALCAPIGLFLGRLANFINGELYGRVTSLPWGVIFPGTEGLPRHPSQIYEALLEGILIFIVLFYYIFKTESIRLERFNSGMFLILYASSRIFIEFFREPDQHIGFFLDFMTMGQLISLPMLLVGLYLVFTKKINDNRIKS